MLISLPLDEELVEAAADFFLFGLHVEFMPEGPEHGLGFGIELLTHDGNFALP